MSAIHAFSTTGNKKGEEKVVPKSVRSMNERKKKWGKRKTRLIKKVVRQIRFV